MSDVRDSLLVRHRMLVILLAGLLMFVATIGLRELAYPDEPDLAEVARAMYLSGDWVVPLRNGEPWVDYPPLLYWAGCTFSHLFGGMSAFSLRLPSALAAILLALATCAAASRWFGRRTGLFAGLILLTFAQFTYNAIGFRPDPLFALAIGCGTLLYAVGVGRSGSGWLRVAGFACFGLAVLAKGPLGILLPGLVLTLWHASRREWRRLLLLAPLGLVAVVVAAPWYLACAAAQSPEWLWGELYMQNFERFGEGVRYQGHIRPWWYYPVYIWADLAPWSLLLPFALWWTVRSRLGRRPEVQLCLWWFGAWFVFFSIAATKRELYLLPAYPAAALLIAPYLVALFRPEPAGDHPDPRPAQALGLGFAALLVGVGVASLVAAAGLELGLQRVDPYPSYVAAARAMRPGLAVLGGVMIVGGAWIWRARGRLGSLLGRFAAVLVALIALLLGLVFPGLDPARTYVPACQWIRAEIGESSIDSDTRLGLLYPIQGRNKVGAFAYHTGIRVVLFDTERANDEEEVEQFLASHPGALVLLYAKAAKRFFEDSAADWDSRVIHEFRAGRRDYLVLR